MIIIPYLDMAFTIFRYMLFGRIIMSWFKLPNNQVFHYIWDFLYEMTEPVLAFFRRLMPPAMVGAVGIDFSPIIAFIVLQFAWGLVRSILISVLSSAGV